MKSSPGVLPMASPADLAFEKGLPSNPDAERYVLGSILLNDSAYLQAAGALEPDDFSLEKHRRIFARMKDLYDRGSRIDRITLADELMKQGQLESVDGLSYLISLDDGLPELANLDGYIRIVKDKSTLRKLIFNAQKVIHEALIGEREPDEILASAEESLLKLGEGRTRDQLNSPSVIVEQFPGGVGAFLDPSQRIRGLSTGFAKFDEMTGGLNGGELIILAARPSMGKTALALNIAQHVATNPRMRKPVAVFSLEMSSASLLTRLVCAAARVDQHKFRAGFLNQEERRKLQEALFDIMQSPLFLDDTAGVNLMDVHSKLRRLKNEHGLSLVVIDYLQLMSGRGRAENRNQEVSAISRGLKLLAKDLNVPFLVLSQLSRASETRPGDHKPQLSDLRDSGCLTGDTLVTLACTGQSLPIRDLIGKKRMRVWSLNQESLRLEPADVSNAFSTGTKTVFRMTTQLGRSICATANHRFLEFGGWKRLDELKVGDYIALPRVVPSPSRTSMKPAELALLGHLLGDGCTLPRHVLQYTTKDRDLAEAVVEFALEVFGADVAPRIRPERQWLQVHLSSTRRHTHGVGSPVADWLKQLGAWGLRAYEKQIPRKVFEQDAESTALFLRHLWSTDGAIHLGKRQPRIYYASSSQSLSRDVQSLLVRLGINARIRPVEQRARPHYRRQFPVAVTGKPDLVRFCERVGAFGARKLAVLERVREHLSSISANTNRDVLPADVWRRFALPAMRQQGISGRGLASMLGIAYNGSQLYRQNLGREHALRIARATASEPLRNLADSDVYWDRISSVESLGEQEVFDLTVPGHENFIANDVIVHNSIEQDADLVGFIYREEVYKRDREDLKGLADLIVAKQRNGPIGVVPLRFLGQFTRFENRAEDLADLPPEE
ncbi:MAG TPA: replicative DNA helicase [Bryobacteraceae bacterium]|nr:replicative DNA helicase [Bryobacteraceae bacterium]